MNAGKKAASCVLHPLLENSHRPLIETTLLMWHLAFSRTLGLHQHADITSFSKEEGLACIYTVPKFVCTSVEDPYLSCCTLAGLFDEHSSTAILLSDRTFRPGVSVSLTTEMLRKVHPGDRVRLTSKVVKIGKVLGYADMTAHLDSCGTLIGRGRHIKYLPMGLQWDILTSTGLKGLLLYLHNKNMKNRFLDEKWTKGTPNDENLSQQVALQELLVKHEKDGIIHGNAKLEIHRNISNFLGSFHGGAICAAAENIAFAAGPPQTRESQFWISHIDTHYYNAQRREAQIQSVYRPGVLFGGNSTVLFHKKGQPMAESRMLWSPV